MSLFDSPLAAGPEITDTRFTTAVHDAAAKRRDDDGPAGTDDPAP